LVSDTVATSALSAWQHTATQTHTARSTVPLSSQVLDLERPKDAISVLVRLIVQQPNHKLVKRTLAESLQTPLGLECLYEELSTAASVASALVRTP
jgi:hypothetical protein